MYLQRIEDFITSLFEDLRYIINGKASVMNYNFPSINRVLDYLHDNTLYPVKGRAAFRIIEGIVIGLFNVKNEGLRCIVEALNDTKEVVERDWKDTWKNGLEEIEPEFF